MRLQQLRRHIVSTLAVFGLSHCPVVLAQNLVVNGDFATDSLAGWSGNGGIFVVPGEFQASMDGGASATLYQFLNTTPGEAYDISFDLSSITNLPGLDSATTFSVSFDGTLLSQRTLPDAGTGYGLTFSSVTASGTSASLFFSSQTNFITFKLDNVVVTPTAVPEPSTYSALAGVAALVAITFRRRRH